MSDSLSPEQKEKLQKMKRTKKTKQVEEPENTEIDTLTEKLLSAKGEYRYAFEEKNDMKEFDTLVPDMKRKYSFELDTFQKKAIYHMELGQHVFVIAHTSAGKTATAEYAIALAQSKGMKAIYTSPIKALSNQKYYDFRKIFGKVGIITGDVVIQQPDDLVTIMTTEILRSKLYQDAKFIDDVDWVIFDEVHYVNDEERGVVWEEVIMNLPPHVKMLMLSATVENAINFAEWIGRTKQQKVCLVKTLHRPVPLQHYVFCGKSKENKEDALYMFKKGEISFLNENYLEAYKRIVPKFMKGKKMFDAVHDVKHLQQFIEFLDKDGKLPCVFFIFSRKLVMDYAKRLAKSTQFDINAYKVQTLFQEMTEGLVESEKNLPQIKEVKALLLRGVGVHHAGLLPFLKEIVEVLFSQGILKVLFATETFAMGVNMPAKTVVFPSVEKFDGEKKRFLNPGEYTQMSGRAGRRGIDPIGNVILFPNKVLPSSTQMQNISCGAPAKMKSQFYVTYWMLLNWLTSGSDDVSEKMIKSFSKIDLFEMANRALIAQEAQKVLEKDEEQAKCSNPNCDHEALILIKKEINEIRRKITEEVFIAKAQGGAHFYKTGRVVKFSREGQSFYGIILDKVGEGFTVYYFDKTEGRVTPINLRDIKTVYNKVLYVKGTENYTETTIELGDKKIKTALYDRLNSIITRKYQEPLFQPYQSEKKRPMNVKELFSEYTKNVEIMIKMPAFTCSVFKKFNKESGRRNKLQKLANDILLNYESNKMVMDKDLENRLDVLKHFEFIDKETNILTLKGKVAKEMVSSDGMILTNMLFDGLLNKMEVYQLAALFSVFVFEPSNESMEELIGNFKPETNELIDLLEKYAMEIVDYENTKNIEYTIEKYVKMNYGLMEGVALWTLKKPFNEVIDASATTEGLIVRCILRIEQVVEEVTRAAAIIGNEEMTKKCATLTELLKRDIVNVKSLYLRDTAIVEGKAHAQGFKPILVDTNEALDILDKIEDNGRIVVGDGEEEKISVDGGISDVPFETENNDEEEEMPKPSSAQPQVEIDF
ncbi:helicase, putative [Entamoeba invadens IP1]|uniref:Helicase, putative n=1 Tax=Entamoeba invadens IP1 TaxID=370355 RepID=A0A0A1U6K3_ENTIV|nr:helicase, putative [Entamoeba invadens IP1]ELP90027.1 helicase, putative [Entamoeba invadens IP1]|eukprot:XP_004256798.1 helicase, putative [Entamoeba invadens IP1]